MADFVGAIDQGTTSSRFMIFDHGGNERGRHQLEHAQILPRAGWVEHNPVEIWERSSAVLQTAMNAAGLAPSDLAALGVTNQRETTVVWNRKTGRPVLQRHRVAGHAHRPDRQRARPGRPRRRHPRARPVCRRRPTSRRQAAVDPRQRRRACAPRPSAATRSFGTIDTLGDLESDRRDRRRRPRHRRDQRQPHHADGFGDAAVGRRAARFLRASRARCCRRSGRRRTRASTATRGDRAARRRISGRRRPRRSAGRHRRPGLLRAGRSQEHLRHRQFHAAQHRRRARAVEDRAAHDGRYQIGDDGSRSTRWRDRSRSPARRCSGCAISSASSAAPPRSKALARQVDDNGGMYFVPAFSGLFAPYWRSDARGAIVGLSASTPMRISPEPRWKRSATRRATSSTRWPPTPGVRLEVLKVDGGATANELLHAAAGRHPRRAGRPAGRRRNHRAGRRLCRRSCGRVLGRHRRTARELERIPALEAGVVRRRSAPTAMPAGARRFRAPWTGSTVD